MALALCDEYNYRFEKGDTQHKCRALIEKLRMHPCKSWRDFDGARNPSTPPTKRRKLLPPVHRLEATQAGLTDMPLCTGPFTVPLEYRTDIVTAYRAYYRSPGKEHTLRYNQPLRQAPYWSTFLKTQ